MNLSWAEFYWIFLALGVLPFGIFLKRQSRSRFRIYRRWTQKKIDEQAFKAFKSGQRGTFFLDLLAILLIVASIMGPRTGFETKEWDRKGRDLMIALDLSQSMMSQDLSPNRLARAKLKIIDLLDQLKGYRVGLIGFAGMAFLQTPLTEDYEAYKVFLDEMNPELAPVPGTAIGAAINLAKNSMPSEAERDRILLIFTDGEDSDSTWNEIDNKGLKTFIVGMATEQGAPVPDTQGDFKRDRNGRTVISSLDVRAMEKMAQRFNGDFLRYEAQNGELQKIISRIESAVQTYDLGKTKTKIYTEVFQWPLGFGLLCFLLGRALEYRKRQELLRTILLLLFCIGSLCQTPRELFAQSLAEKRTQAGIAAYNAKEYDKAVQLFGQALAEEGKNPSTQKLLADALYRAGKYSEAEKLYQALSKERELPKSHNHLYNLGNARFQQKNYQGAIEAYEEALNADPKDQDTQANLKLARSLLEKKPPSEEPKPPSPSPSTPPSSSPSPNPSSEPQSEPKPEDQKSPGPTPSAGPSPESAPSPSPGSSANPEPKDKASAQPSAGPSESPRPQPEPSPANTAGPSSMPMPEPSSPEPDSTPEEAKLWLDSLKEDRSEFLKRRYQNKARRSYEQDW